MSHPRIQSLNHFCFFRICVTCTSVNTSGCEVLLTLTATHIDPSTSLAHVKAMRVALTSMSVCKSWMLTISSGDCSAATISNPVLWITADIFWMNLYGRRVCIMLHMSNTSTRMSSGTSWSMWSTFIDLCMFINSLAVQRCVMFMNN